MTSYKTSLLAIALALPFIGCSAEGPTSPANLPVEKALLIGQSPLIVLDATKPAVEVTAEVTRGLTNVKIEDKFKVRTTVAFTGLGIVGPLETSLVGVKDDGVRHGGEVSIIICIEIPDPLWDAIQSAGAFEAKATVELIMTDGAGKEHVLDTGESVSVLNSGNTG